MIWTCSLHGFVLLRQRDRSWPADTDYDDENISGYMQSYNSGYSNGYKKGYIARLEEEDTECDAD